ncbi:MarR family transcriptional regulator [Anaerotignum lactatifermentans]|uniref:MarR family winged helix-turn-helix transcriptional regulator n=1 Tax=Anaerotignum lactatifermentans TaxID=160404 RepID=UPI00307C8185
MQPKISFCLEWKMVSNLMRHSANACTTCVEATNLTGMQLFILEYLYQHQEQDVFQRDLEAEFHVRRSTVTGILKGMEKKRLSVEEDARLKRIVLTPQAKSLHREVEMAVVRMEKIALRGLSEAEIEVFLEILEKMKANLQEDMLTYDEQKGK